MKSVIFKPHCVTIALLFSLLSLSTAQANNSAPIRIGDVLIPASFATALHDGLSVPVQLRYHDESSGTDTTTEDPVGNATLQLKGNGIYLLNMDFSAGKRQGLLNDALINKLSVDDDRSFDANGQLIVDKDATMRLDLVAMQMTIEVSRAAFSKPTGVSSSRGESLTPSVDSLSSVHRYNLGYSFNNNSSGYLDSNYLQLASTFGLAEQHLFLDGSLYNVGQEGQSGQIYRAMYERDINNRRIAGGMVSTWDLQSLGLVSALNAGRIYGVSYGNHAFSSKNEASISTTPVQVFMPADGEVRVYREGRMIALVNLPIGNQTVDSSSFPNGLYNVTVEVYVDGRLVNTTIQRVTKLGNSNQFVNGWGWQAWGGWMEASSFDQANSPVVGLSVSRTFGALTFSGSNYAFNESVVGEGGIQWQPMDNLSLGAQSMVASEGSYRLGGNVSLQLLDNLSLWASQEKQVNGDRLQLSSSDQVSIGSSLNLGGWVDRLGQLSFSTTHDRAMGSIRSYLDYSQNLYSGSYGTLMMRASLQNNSTGFGNSNNKSVTLDYTIPLGNLFSFGMSSNELGQTTANLGYQTYLDGVIDRVSVNAQRTLSGDVSRSPAISGSVGFAQKSVGGSLSMSRSSSGDLNGNLVAAGSLATVTNNLSLSNQNNNNAGLMIETGLGDEARLQAKINGQDYAIEGRRTFVSLPPYQEYEVELLNSDRGLDTYEVNSEKKRYTLFPGNVAHFDASSSIREMVTVFGIIRTEDGTVMANARLDNHIGTTVTNETGEFSLDVDKANPMLMFKRDADYCEAELDLRNQTGAAWVGDVICRGLSSYAYMQ
ncbi:CS1-pili formation C-terminal domain-containing protein [Aeromonas hydrophila]|uniref:CS1-pili formation C-terminal domain-containing protein n=1 Tax=Aeromonas hydrophila TaxID=644 RepID=UPI0022AE8232|nr:CS1-pili formation C-terminal domain-containing protein [Aeromonas hydrophila]MCZ4335575.1 CS1-pili formation C-terminal domain-containing protein [Aeromonas hydrophila]